MQTIKRILITAFVFGMSLSATAAEKYALLIAVAKYDHAEMNKPAPLEFPEEDAKALGKLLESGGYKVELLLGKAATLEAIKPKLTALQKKADAEGVVLIGLFGHGVEVDTVDSNGEVIKDGCFCPYNTAMREAVDFRGKPVLDAKGKTRIEPDPDTLIKLGDLMRTLKLAKAGNRIVLADCCRTTPNAARGRSSFGANFSVQDLPENTSLLFGCSPNEQAFEHKDWGHGAFTKCLLDTIGELSAEGPVDTAQLASQMKKRVPALVASVSPRDRQTPKPFITDVVDLQLVLPESTSGDEIISSIGLKLKLIPAGEFIMGSPADEEDRSENEGPQHRVGITKPFYMGITEVTQGQWFAVMRTRPWTTVTVCEVKKGENFSAVNMTWNEAVEFCRKLSDKDGKAYRLPYEAEWEYACRGGTDTAYSFGSSSSVLSEYSWWKENATRADEDYAHEVGTKKPNPFGLYDMHGNVWEWCQDVYSEQSYGSRRGLTLDPISTSGSEYRVARGGSWHVFSGDPRSAQRTRDLPVEGNENYGFRIVLQ